MDMNTIYTAMPDSEEKRKMEKDYSEEVKVKLPELKKIAVERGKVDEAVEALLAFEKQTRQGGDEPSTTKVARCIVEVCFEARDWPRLKETLVTLSKRRQQFKQTVQSMTQLAMQSLMALSDKAVKLELIDTLRVITEGKIYVEVERARLTRYLAQIKEDEGNVSEAAELLQEIQVETFGTMDAKEKLEFILDQMRLCLAKGDFVRAHIIARKVTNKALAKPEFQEIKVRYYELMVRYYAHQKVHFNLGL